MPWIDSITEVNERLTPIAIDERGHTAPGSLSATRNLLPPKGNLVAKVVGVSLQDLHVADAGEYLAVFGYSHANRFGHEVYRFQYKGRQVFIPAAVLLSALLARLSAFGDRLLDASSLDMLARPRLKDGGLYIEFHKASRLTSGKEHPEVQRRFTWLTCFPSARRFWASVYVKAQAGTLGCTLPLCTIDASVYGRRTQAGIFVTRMNIKALTPTEPPLPFAVGNVPQSFKFNELKTKHASAVMSAYRAEHTYRLPAESGVPRGPAGWKMTDDEWQAVLQALKAHGMKAKLCSKETLDIALERCGSGVAWSTVEQRRESALTVYSHWKTNGKWEVLKATLVDIRSPSNTSRATASIDVSGASAGLQLTLGEHGWQMSDDEWDTVRMRLGAKGLHCRRASKPSIDLALEKIGSGVTWEQMGPNHKAANATFSLWNRTGRWKALVEVLISLRTATPGRLAL